MPEYKTVQNSAQAEFTEKRSRFIGTCKPIKTEEEAIAFINEMRSKYWDARHNVYAYSLRDGQIMRYSDDGEPQGTAGIPVLEILQKGGITDAVIVVTRYFGGILLGTGGLVRAYSHSAKLALAEAQVITMRECILCSLICSYTQYGKISSLIPELGGVQDDVEYADNVKISFHIEETQLGTLNKQLADATGGTVSVEVSDDRKYFKV